jgi:hypothetical protein
MILGDSFICSLEAVMMRADFGHHDVFSSIDIIYIYYLSDNLYDCLYI